MSDSVTDLNNAIDGVKVITSRIEGVVEAYEIALQAAAKQIAEQAREIERLKIRHELDTQLIIEQDNKITKLTRGVQGEHNA